MSTRKQQRLSGSSLLLLALAFVAAIIISNQLFKGWRFDLTDNNLYTLSDGTKRILDSIDEPINLYFYYSDQATANIPSLRSYAGPWATNCRTCSRDSESTSVCRCASKCNANGMAMAAGWSRPRT